tara:strand:+ start:19479 stop:20918 length:1440 start_codon:yes stop_codon:yes gene_type:complete
MKLRQWQAECIQLALKKYMNGASHFLALATPGAGKTVMASELADQLLKNDRIDLVICFAPSSMVARDFGASLHARTQYQFDGKLGAKGHSLTYQSLQYLDDSFWQLFKRFRVFVIFDEIHHCAGSNIENANAWGEKIILNIQNKAEFTLALTGTPWRSDAAPIVLSNYTTPYNKISCDYVYGLADALRDDVCRVPQIVAIDNDKISVADDEYTHHFNSFKALLSQSIIPYQEVIQHEDVMRYLLLTSNKKLRKIRKINPNAAGLIVASSVEHARSISQLMKRYFDEHATLVTYQESEPTRIIEQFREDSTSWIISVGMISEGTNIPRLQVCCHLTNIKTEMHFRQILGRILRVTGSKNQEAVMYMPAEPKLLEYAYRVNQDVPAEAGVVKFEKMAVTEREKNKGSAAVINFDKGSANIEQIKDKPSLIVAEFCGTSIKYTGKESAYEKEEHFLTQCYQKSVNIFGKFKQEAIALSLSEL